MNLEMIRPFLHKIYLLSQEVYAWCTRQSLIQISFILQVYFPWNTHTKYLAQLFEITDLFIPSPCTFRETPPQKICAQISKIPRHFVLPKPTIFQFTYVNPTCPWSLDHPNFSHNFWKSQIKLFFMYPQYSCWKSTGIILCMCPANGRWCYNVASSLIGWVHTQNDSWSMKYANPMCP